MESSESTSEPNQDYTRQSVFTIDVIIEHTLKTMPMKQLQSCACVCKQWYAIAERVKRSRQAISWLFYSPQLHCHDVVDQVTNRINVLSAEPRQAIVFISSSLYEDHIAVPGSSDSQRPRNAKMSKLPFMSYLKQVLPGDCQTLTLCSDGVVGCDYQNQCYEVETALAASCFLIPHIDGVNVRHFTATAEQLENHLTLSPLSAETTNLSLQSSLADLTGLPEEEKPKLILLFYIEYFSEAETELATRLLMNYKDVVIAGGYMDHGESHANTFNHSLLDEPSVIGITFSGDDIQVSSAVIKSDVNTQSEVETSLKKLKDSHVRLGPHTVGFMFACIGRGQYHYQQQGNVESGVFHKLFPSIPLFGFFGNGEIGFEYLPDYRLSPEQRAMNLVHMIEGDCNRWHLPDIHHSYTTIFVLLSLK